jgi:hypothetical protein
MGIFFSSIFSFNNKVRAGRAVRSILCTDPERRLLDVQQICRGVVKT